MSKITIIPEDKAIIVDSEAIFFDFVINPNVHAVHWDDVLNEGHEEFKDGNKNKPLNNFNPYNHLLAKREQAIIDQEAERVAEEQARADAAQAEEDAIEAGRSQMDRRLLAYPTSETQLAALHYARNGDTALLDSIDAAMDAVDLQFPLET